MVRVFLLVIFCAIMTSAAKSIEQYSSDEVCALVSESLPKLDGEAFDNIIRHKIDGEIFLALNDEYLRELVPLLGDRLKIRKLINQLINEQPSTVSPFELLVKYSSCFSYQCIVL